MFIYLGWIVAAFLGGFLLALWQRKKVHTLRENFARVEAFSGRGYREILAIAGAKPYSIIRQADGRSIRMWKESGYSIVLEFDARDICLGVVDEIY
jgi:hypothetical protein